MSSQLIPEEKHISKYPVKCRRFPELTEQFLAQKQNNNNNELNYEQFTDLMIDKDIENEIKEIVDHYNEIKNKTVFYPSIITKEDMIYMLNEIKNTNRRKRHLNFLFIREFDIWRNNKKDEELSREKREKERLEIENFGQIGCFDANNNIQYGYWKNTLFSRYFNNSYRKYSSNLLRNASLFGQKIVIDCSFDEEMEEYETSSVGRQMARIYGINKRLSKEPFDLHFVNCDQNSRVLQHFRRYLNFSDYEKHYVNCHKESYSELFPNQRLIYLTPDARPIMTEFDPNAIYIMGALVGKTCKLPLTAFKARREGLQHFRLPIHLFVKLAPNVKKVLSFQGVFRTLLEVKDHGNWKLAFERGIQEHKLKD